MVLKSCSVDAGSAGIQIEDTEFRCPIATNFFDTYDGMYGPNGSYSSYDFSSKCYYRSGTLEFSCISCGQNTYSLEYGYSYGAPGNKVPSLSN